MNRLYKSNKDKVFEGVCGGLGEYFNIDPVIIRLLWLVLVVFGGTGILAYLIAMFIIPRNPENQSGESSGNEVVSSETFSNRFWGVILFMAGLLLLFGVVGPVAGVFAGITLAMGHILWPVLLIGLGLYLYFNENEKEGSPVMGSIFPEGKTLYKSKSDAKLAGVCGGIGQYFNIDANIIRIFWAVATLGSFGFGVLAYGILAIYLQESE